MKQAVYECDVCKTKDFPEKVKGVEDPLPKNWAEMNLWTNHGWGKPLELCPACIRAITDVIEARYEL